MFICFRYFYDKGFAVNGPHCGQDAIQMVIFVLDQLRHILKYGFQLF